MKWLKLIFVALLVVCLFIVGVACKNKVQDKFPDASLIWQNRLRRFNGTDIDKYLEKF